MTPPTFCEMPAVTVDQPAASVVARGLVPLIEAECAPPESIAGDWIAIYAGPRFCIEAQAAVDAILDVDGQGFGPTRANAPAGVVVAVGRLVGVMGRAPYTDHSQGIGHAELRAGRLPAGWSAPALDTWRVADRPWAWLLDPVVDVRRRSSRLFGELDVRPPVAMPGSTDPRAPLWLLGGHASVEVALRAGLKWAPATPGVDEAYTRAWQIAIWVETLAQRAGLEASVCMRLGGEHRELLVRHAGGVASYTINPERLKRAPMPQAADILWRLR